MEGVDTSPGREPGNGGAKGHPAHHAAWGQAARGSGDAMLSATSQSPGSRQGAFMEGVDTSPGREPGDGGSKGHPAHHAARGQAPRGSGDAMLYATSQSPGLRQGAFMEGVDTSPGREPGDGGSKGHPAHHAARGHDTTQRSRHHAV